MKLESDRLFLHPASDEEMEELIKAEEDTGLKKAYSEMLEGCTREPENRIWYAAWFIELKNAPGTYVGDLASKA